MLCHVLLTLWNCVVQNTLHANADRWIFNMVIYNTSTTWRGRWRRITVSVGSVQLDGGRPPRDGLNTSSWSRAANNLTCFKRFTLWQRVTVLISTLPHDSNTQAACSDRLFVCDHNMLHCADSKSLLQGEGIIIPSFFLVTYKAY